MRSLAVMMLASTTTGLAVGAQPPPSFASFFVQRNFQGLSFPVTDFTCYDFTPQYQRQVVSFAINNGYTCTLYSQPGCKGNAPYYYYGNFVNFDGSQAQSVKCGQRKAYDTNGAVAYP